jgi:hypothetical protein
MNDLQARVVERQIVELANAALGSAAVVREDCSSMPGLGWKADNQPGGMSAPTDSGRSGSLKQADLNGG